MALGNVKDRPSVTNLPTVNCRPVHHLVYRIHSARANYIYSRVVNKINKVTISSLYYGDIMIRTQAAKKYGGTNAMPLTEFSFIVPEKLYVVQDAEINGEKCIIIREDKGTSIKLNKIEDELGVFFGK